MGPTGTNPNTSGTGSYPQMKEKIPQGYSKGLLQQFTPEQMQLFQQLFSHVGPESFLSKLAGGDEGAFGQIEAPALKQFSALQGGLASRFSGMGGTGGRKSSGFQNTMNSASSDFAQQLQSQRQQLQQQALKDLMGFSSNLLGQKPYETTLTEKPKSGLEAFFSNLAGGVGQGFGKTFGGSLGGALGGSLFGGN